MNFELTEALMDDILFSMEDQEGKFYIDSGKGVVAGGEDGAEEAETDEDDFIDLPKWDSSDGFRLMERFAAGFRSPLVREELSSALNQGRGVFRAFKNVLRRYPEAEKVWFAFKEREMKRKILAWYNILREEWGLERIGLEPEETGDLLLEDFRFFSMREEDVEPAMKLHASCEKENCADKYYSSGGFEKSAPPGKIAWSAESGNGEFAGFISASLEGKNYYIDCLDVKPEYRGLGIGEALLSRFLESIDTMNNAVYIELPAGAEGFSRVLAREKFSPCMTRYCLELKDRV